jgi:hypothetical protein
METFTEPLQAWEMFYSTVATASVTRLGLLSVSLSFHRESLKGRADPRVLRLARGNFGDFLFVLMLGLVFLVPHPAPAGLAVAPLVLGASPGIGPLRPLFRPAPAKTGKRILLHVLR